MHRSQFAQTGVVFRIGFFNAMRSENDVRPLLGRVALGKSIRFQHIQSGQQPSLLKFGKKRLLMDDPTARCVDDNAVVREFGKEFGGNRSPRFLRKPGVNHNCFRLMEQFFEAAHPNAVVGYVLDIGVVNPNDRAEGPQHIHESPADDAETVNTHV